MNRRLHLAMGLEVEAKYPPQPKHPPKKPMNGPVPQRIMDLISTAEGRAQLAAQMTAPLRMQRDYVSAGRRTFLVEQLPDGALPVYENAP